MTTKPVQLPPPPEGPGRPTVLARIYPGHHAEAVELFQEDAETLVGYGYHPVAQSYAPGRYPTTWEWAAVLLLLVGIGFVILLIMAAIRPPGSLAVTYELREPPAPVA
jgi:hypothetical protein